MGSHISAPAPSTHSTPSTRPTDTPETKPSSSTGANGANAAADASAASGGSSASSSDIDAGINSLILQMGQSILQSGQKAAADAKEDSDDDS